MSNSSTAWRRPAGWLALVVFALFFLSGCVLILTEPDDEGRYDLSQELHFAWGAYPFPDDVNGSYRIALLQASAFGTAEYKVAHHWAANPNGTQFVMGSFSDEEIRTGCDLYADPGASDTYESYIVVQPETYELMLDPDTGVYEYHYTPVTMPDWMEEQCECGPPDEDYPSDEMVCTCPSSYPAWLEVGDDVPVIYWIQNDQTMLQLSAPFCFRP